MENDKIVDLLKLVATTLQTDYEDTKCCKEAIIHLLKEVDKMGIELTGNSILKQKTLLEHLCFPQGQKKPFRQN